MFVKRGDCEVLEVMSEEKAKELLRKSSKQKAEESVEKDETTEKETN